MPRRILAHAMTARTLVAGLLVLYALLAWLLAGVAIELEHWHLVLDASNAALASLFALFLWGSAHARTNDVFRGHLAVAFVFVAASEVAHALIGVEWLNGLAWISASSGFLLPATWPPSTYMLPLAMGRALPAALKRQPLGRFALANAAILLALYLFFLSVPSYVDTGILGIRRPFQLPVLPLLAGVGWLIWRQRAADPLFHALVASVAFLFLSDFFMLWSVAPGDHWAIVAHVGKFLAYALAHGAMLRQALADSQARDRAEADLRSLGADLERQRLKLDDLVQQRTAELAVAKEAAEAANGAKSAFLANISHEMRTPLHIIVAISQLLRRDLADPVQRHRVDQLCTNSDHLLALINDTLDLSKIEAARLELDHSDFLLGSVVERVLGLIAEPAREKSLALTVDIAPALRELALRGDPLRLAQILINLGGNAIKFTERGTVRLVVESLAATAAGERLRFAVEDNGIGIAPADQARLFQAFTQVDASPQRAAGGSGLGLAISQRLAVLMGGRIEVSSSLGAGSTFSFELDLPHAAGLPAPDAAAVATDFGGRRVLFAEDHPLSQELLFEMIEDLGCDPDVAADGLEALECARTRDYDLILMDMQMPKMDGLAATRAIRALDRHRDTPIVALTANVFAEDRRRCLEAGMNGHLAKPVTPATLAATLAQWLPGVTVPLAGHAADSALGQALAATPQLNTEGMYWQRADRIAEYRDLLLRYVELHGDDMARVRAQLAAGAPDAARELVHKLKGMSGFIGARQVATRAEELMVVLRADPAASAPAIAICAAALADLVAAVGRLPAPEDA